MNPETRPLLNDINGVTRLEPGLNPVNPATGVSKGAMRVRTSGVTA